MTSSQQTALELVDAFPRLAPIMERQVDELGELLPTLFMGEVAEWATDLHATDPAQVRGVVDWLEERFRHGDPDVQDMIGVGFVEMLPAGRAGDGGIVDELGGHLRAVAVDLGVLDQDLA